MKKIYVPTGKPEDWQRLLADPEKHWKTGYSAKALAYCWEEADGFPKEIAAALWQAGFEEQEILIAIPEYEVPLAGGKRPSQNDLFVLAKLNGKLAVVMVEGKVDEDFGAALSSWKPDSTSGRRERLNYLKEVLGLQDDPPADIRYQLLHRAASPIIEAKRFNADIAIMLVHSFSQIANHFEDYEKFMALFGKVMALNSVGFVKIKDGIDFYSGWIVGSEKYLSK